MSFEHLNEIREETEIYLRELRRVFYLIGVNICDYSPSLVKKIFLKCWCITLITCGFISIYGNYNAFILNLRKDLSISIEAFCLAFQILISIFKLIVILFTEDKFQKLYKTVETYELLNMIPLLSKEFNFNKTLRDDAKAILKKCWKIARMQLFFYLYACSAIITLYFFGALIANTYHYVKGTPGYVNIFSTPSYYPSLVGKINSFPWYPILTYVFGCSSFIAGMAAFAFDGFYLVLCMHAVALLKINQKMIKFSTSDAVPKKLRVPILLQSVKHYTRTYRFCADTNNIFSLIAFCQLAISLVVLGAVIFQMFVGLQSSTYLLIRMILYISAAGYEVVIYNLNAQFVTTQSEILPNAWYNTIWYNESKEYKQIVYMMILRTNRPTVLWAWSYTKLSFPTLLSFLQTSGSYFLLLKNVTE